jgi:hypothetical protein
MSEGHKDYSATPLWKKLGIREGSRVFFAGQPEGFRAELSRLAPLPPGVEIMARAANGLDVAVVFGIAAADLAARFSSLVPRIEQDGRLWVAWPKKAAKMPTDVTFEVVQAMGLSAGLVDNKTAAISEVFQGLQFVYRLADRR